MPAATESAQKSPEALASAFRKCSQCHGTQLAERLGTITIPLHDEAELKNAVAASPDLAGKILSRIHDVGSYRMPPNQPLSSSELTSLTALLESSR